MQLSRAIQNCTDDPMRRYDAQVAAAQQRGKEILFLNGSQPEVNTPDIFFAAAGAFVPAELRYAPAQGMSIMTEAMQRFYREHGVNYALDQILITAGASEALLLALQAILDAGSEVVVPEPCNPSYRTAITACGGVVRTVFTTPEEGYCYAAREKLEPLITPNTRAILCCNPCDPTGTVLTRAQMQLLADIARAHGLWLIADEAYREFVYDTQPISFGQLRNLDEQLILLESASKQFFVSGARVGALITRNRSLMDAVRKLAQIRLCAGTLNQVAAAELYLMGTGEHFVPHREEFARRRAVCLAALRELPGVVCAEPQGAYFLMARLPVDDTDRFQHWLLTEFDLDGQTILLAPGSGFYSTQGCGRSEVRISYTLSCDALERAMQILREALRQYPGTKKR